MVIPHRLTSAIKLSNSKADFKGVIASLLSILLVAPLYCGAICVLHFLSRSLTAPASIVTIVIMILVMPLIVIALRKPVRDKINRAVYGWRLPYHQMVLNSPAKLSNVLNISELAEELLKPMPQALMASHASLLLPSNGSFVSKFSSRLSEAQPPSAITLNRDSLIVKWLEGNNTPLSLDPACLKSKFGKLDDTGWPIKGADVGLLVPMVSQDKLVGIIALGARQMLGPYSKEDIAILTDIGKELARTLENAQIYTATIEKVYTDDLTGLMTHGYFHKRVDEEISRCSRFGNIFAVLFIDVDLFKSYNDAFGHLAGDTVLGEIAQCMKESIRSLDTPCRYGGDEFAVILPESSPDDAYNIAERIREKIETKMDSRGIAITCSIGVASWPTSGATRESLLIAADSALYWSKQAGRNRVTVASSGMQSLSSSATGEEEILEAIHALAATVDAKDHYTYGHSKKTSEYALLIAQELGFSGEKVALLKAAALLHDIGKIRVPDNVLFKPGPLDYNEWASVREHPKFGVTILRHIKGLAGCLSTIQHHHEHFDGNGYPAGLTGDNIPIEARILAVADAYDAMTSARPYRINRLNHQDAIRELLRCSGTYFDPEIVKVFAAMWEPLDLRMLAKTVTRQKDYSGTMGSKEAEPIL